MSENDWLSEVEGHEATLKVEQKMHLNLQSKEFEKCLNQGYKQGMEWANDNYMNQQDSKITEELQQNVQEALENAV